MWRPVERNLWRTLPMTPNPAQQLMQITTGYVASSALHVGVSLNIADLPANGEKTAAELASLTGANEDALYRILRCSRALACSI